MVFEIHSKYLSILLLKEDLEQRKQIQENPDYKPKQLNAKDMTKMDGIPLDFFKTNCDFMLLICEEV